MGQNRENCDKIKFVAQLPAKHDSYDRLHQIKLLCKKFANAVILLFFPKN